MKVKTIHNKRHEDFVEELAYDLSNDWQHLSSGYGCYNDQRLKTANPGGPYWWAIVAKAGEQGE